MGPAGPASGCERDAARLERGAGPRQRRRRHWHAAAAPGPPGGSPTLPRPAPTAVQYDAKLCEFMDTYDRAFLVHADNVGSKQFMDIRAVSWERGPARWGCERSTGRRRRLPPAARARAFRQCLRLLHPLLLPAR